MKCTITVVALSLLLAGNAFAFDVNGFRAGMTLDEGLRVLQSRVDRVVPVEGNEGRGVTYLGTRVSGPSEALTFCEGRLTSYQYDVAGGIRAFVRLVERERLLVGPGVSEVGSHETSSGEWSRIKFSWSRGRDEKEIGYSLVGTSEQVYIRFTVGPVTCK